MSAQSQAERTDLKDLKLDKTVWLTKLEGLIPFAEHSTFCPAWAAIKQRNKEHPPITFKQPWATKR
jgi:hypothetical protein